MKAEEVIEKVLSLSRYIPKTYTEKINKYVALGEEMKQIWRLWDIKRKLTIMLRMGRLGMNDLSIRRKGKFIMNSSQIRILYFWTPDV